MLLNALTKVMYAIMREKYGLDYGSLYGNAKGKKGGKAPAKKKKKQESDSDEFEASDNDYCSDDSLF